MKKTTIERIIVVMTIILSVFSTPVVPTATSLPDGVEISESIEIAFCINGKSYSAHPIMREQLLYGYEMNQTNSSSKVIIDFAKEKVSLKEISKVSEAVFSGNYNEILDYNSDKDLNVQDLAIIAKIWALDPRNWVDQEWFTQKVAENALKQQFSVMLALLPEETVTTTSETDDWKPQDWWDIKNPDGDYINEEDYEGLIAGAAEFGIEKFKIQWTGGVPVNGSIVLPGEMTNFYECGGAWKYCNSETFFAMFSEEEIQKWTQEDVCAVESIWTCKNVYWRYITSEFTSNYPGNRVNNTPQSGIGYLREDTTWEFPDWCLIPIE